MDQMRIGRFLNARLTKSFFDQRNEIISDDKLMADCLNSFFSSVFTEEDLDNIPEAESFFGEESQETLDTITFTIKDYESITIKS